MSSDDPRRKKVSAWCLVVLVLVIVSVLTSNKVFAVSCGGVPTAILNCDEGGSGGISHILKLIIDIMSIGIGILGVVGISWVGIQYLTAGGNTEKESKAKRRMSEIVIGLAVYVVLWGGAQWLMSGDFSALGEDNTGVKTIAIKYSGATDVGKSFSPQVSINEDATNNTYSLTSSNTGVANTLGHSVLCVSEGKVTIGAVAANGMKTSMDINCKKIVYSSNEKGGSQNGNNKATTCDDSSIDKKNGLTYKQAKILAMNYGSNVNNDSKKTAGRIWNACNGGGSNCTSFSAFFYNKFTRRRAKGWSDGATGVLVASEDSGKPMVSYGEKEMKVWSVVARRDLARYGGFGHTGVVVGRQKDGQWIVVQASCQRSQRGKGDGTQSSNGSAFASLGSNAWSALWIDINNAVWARYVYIGDMIDYCLLADYVREVK